MKTDWISKTLANDFTALRQLSQNRTPHKRVSGKLWLIRYRRLLILITFAAAGCVIASTQLEALQQMVLTTTNDNDPLFGTVLLLLVILIIGGLLSLNLRKPD